MIYAQCRTRAATDAFFCAYYSSALSSLSLSTRVFFLFFFIPLQEDGGKNASKQQQQQQQQQQKKQEEARVETCPVKAMKRVLRPATAKELEQLEEKVLEFFP